MDKQVNVKITANTSKFKKAISDATKSLDKFKKSGEKVGKTNIGKNLNKQFKNVSKESKKTDKQLKKNIKTLKNLNKSKLNKLNKQFSNIDKTVKNNRKTLQSLQKTLNNLKSKSIEAINKALTSMSKGASAVSKGFTNVKNVMNNLSNKAIEAIGKSLANIKEKCTPVANGFKTIKDKISSISGKAIDTVKSSLDKIKDKCSPVANGFTNIKNKINDIKAGAFSTLSSKLDGIKTKASDAGNKFRDLKTRISDAAKQTFQKLVDSTTRLNTEGTKSGNVFTNLGNKIKSLTSGALGSLGSKMGLVISSAGKMGSSFSLAGIAAAGAMTKLGASIGVTCLKFAKNASAMLGSINSMSKLTKEAEKLKKTNADLSKKQDDFLNKVNKLNESFSRGTISEEKYKQELSKLSKEQNKLNKESNKFLSTLDKFGQKVANQTTKMGGLAQKNDKLANKLKDLVNRYNELASANGKATLSFDQLINKSTKAGSVFKSLGNIMKSIGGALISVPKRFFNSFKKGLSNFKDGIKGVKESLGNIFNNLSTGNFSGVFGSLKELGASLFKAMPNWVKTVIALGVALKKLYDLGKKRFFEGLSNIKNTLQPVTNFVRNLGSQIKTTFETITSFRLNLTGLVEAGVNFESQMNKVANISGANANQLEKLSDKAKLLGSTTRYQAYQIGQAYEYMGMAGWSAAEMLNGVNAVIDLSILSGSDLATASDIVTDDLTAMGLEANQASDFVDKLAATITRSNTTVELYGESMKQCGAQAGTLGISVTDLNTSIGLMANAGIKGSKAGMSMKNMLANMAAPTEKMEAALKKLGLTADETGSYLKTTADGNVDLEATVKSLMQALKKKNKVEQMSLVTAIAGKNAAPGIIAMLSQGEDAWNDLSDQIENSTQKVQYWNENMHIMGKKGDEAKEIIEKFKDVFEKTEEEATEMGMSTEDLSLSIQLLGADGKVTADNMRDLMKVLDSMNSTSGKTKKKWRDLSKGIKNSNSEVVKAVRTGFDYDTTVADIRSDTSGLTQSQKEQLISQLKTNMSYDEANKLCEKYGLTAKRTTLSSMTYAQKLEYLRETMKGLSDEQIKSKLESLGLSEAYDEVREIVRMSDKDFKQYQKNQETVKSLSEQMAKAMDEDTKGALLGLASAIEGKAIQVFENLKDKIKGTAKALSEFFAAWKETDLTTALLGGYKDEDGNVDIGLVKKVQEAAKQIPKAIQNAIASAKNFITGGGLQGILDMGTSIITGICDGIINSKENLTTAISEAIRKICDWIMQNGDQIKQAGLTILDSIGEAIRQNQSAIDEACNVIYDAINAWAVKNSENIGLIGGIVADDFIWGFLKGFTLEKFSGINGFFQGLFNGGSNPISQWGISSGEDYTKNVNTGIEKGKEQTTSAVSDPFKDAAPEVKATASEIGNSFSDELVSKLKSLDVNSLKSLQDELKNLQTTVSNIAKGISTCFTDIRSSVRDNLVGCTNITRTQFVNIKNIISNQISAARNIVTSKMISINKVVSTQSSAARNNATRNFISLRKVIQTQMSEAYRSVSSYMSKIKSATNQNLHTKINVTKTVETVKKDSNASSLSFANFAKLSSMATNKSLSYASLSTSGIGGDIGSDNGNSSSKPTIIHNYIDLDGKIVAKQTAKYMDGELTILNNKNNRKRGTR